METCETIALLVSNQNEHCFSTTVELVDSLLLDSLKNYYPIDAPCIEYLPSGKLT